MRLKEEAQNQLTSSNHNCGICSTLYLPQALISKTILQESEILDPTMCSSMTNKRPRLVIFFLLLTKRLVSQDYLTLKILNITFFFLQKISLKQRKMPSITRLTLSHKSFLLEPQLLVLEY